MQKLGVVVEAMIIYLANHSFNRAIDRSVNFIRYHFRIDKKQK